MDESLKPLFTPWKIGNLEIKNRIVMTSMGGTDIFGWMEINHFDKEAAKFLMDKAEHDVGLILPGCQPVYNPMLGQWLYRKKGMFKKLKPFMDEIHKHGAKLFVQLTAGFGRSFTISDDMEKLATNRFLNFLSKPIMNFDKICATASPSPNRWSDKVPSREMTIKEIDKFVYAFAETSRLLKEASVDGVEVHAVHEGYLLDQFTLKYINKREDEYGGSFENRYRFAVRIVKAIKEACGNDYPVSLRYSVLSKTKGFRQGALPGEEYQEVGRDFEESKKAIKYLSDAGYDMFNCDNGTYDAWYWAHPPIYMKENCNLEDVEAIKPFTDKPVVCAGRLDPRVASKAIEEGKIDGAGFARPFLADGSWVTKMKEGKEEDIRPCICCHNGCFNMSHWKGHANVQSLTDSLHMSRCAVNAETMQSKVHYIKKTDSPKTVAIIGGGIGGMEAARVLKLRGHNPVIYEKTDHLGGIFIAASSASFKGKLRDLETWYENQMKELQIEIHFNEEVKDIHSIKADSYIIATGSKPRVLKKLPGFDKAIEAVDFLKGKPVGENVVVIGGGLTGCEIAYELCLDGKRPTIVEMKEDLIAQPGICLANSSYLREYFELHKVPVYLETSVIEIKDDAVVVKTKDGQQKELPTDSTIVSVGYIPTPIAQPDSNVYLVGDCNGIGNMRTVVWRSYEVAMKI